MALQSSGEISLNDIETEFGGSPPTAISEYYGAASGVPTSGQISASDFYGTSASFYSYEIDQSLRMDRTSGGRLYRDFGNPTDGKRWTWSGWVKRTDLSNFFYLLSGSLISTNDRASFFAFDNTGKLQFRTWVGSVAYDLRSVALFRDPSAWYHVVGVWDTTQATAANRLRAWVNGVEITSWTGSYPAQNSTYYYTISGGRTVINAYWANLCCYYEHGGSYIAEINFIDGQALNASYFGELKEDIWVPKAYSGSYGTNGFYLKFANSASLGTDSSGNGNTFTLNNLAATDQMLDTPTNNFATFNATNAASGFVLKEGNLYTDTSGGGANHGSALPTTHGMSSGKWYIELTISYGTNKAIDFGVMAAKHFTLNVNTGSDDIYGSNRSAGYYGYSSGYLYKNGSVVQSGVGSFAFGDVFAMAFDADNGTLKIYKNNTQVGSTITGLTIDDQYLFFVDDNTSDNNFGVYLNAGQDSSFAGYKTAQGNADGNGYGDFYYTPPSGYLALCTANLTVAAGVDPGQAAKPADHFNIKLWSGNGSSQNITGYGFNPDLIWIKKRNGVDNNDLTDRVRGANKRLYSNTSGSEETGTTGFITDGVSLGTNGTTNESGYTYVGWGWKANNTSGSTNTSGNITSTVSANQAAGFSIVSYTGSGNSNNSVGHGLSQAPEFVMCKMRSGGEHWCGYHKTYGANYKFRLNSDLGALSDNVFPTNPTSSVFYVAATGNTENNGSGSTYIAYCFHSVDGYSKFGSYTGNGSTDGTFVYTGFRPAFVMVKSASISGERWWMHDSDREAYNGTIAALAADYSGAEETGSVYQIDILSNGFKLRNSHPVQNSSGATYIYMAFAEQPFKYANAR